MAEELETGTNPIKVNWFKSMVTEDDNTSHSVFKWLVLTGVVFGIAFSGYALYADKTFSLSDYGMGLGVMFGAAATALGIVNKTKTDIK
jgi:hypothetical protein